MRKGFKWAICLSLAGSILISAGSSTDAQSGFMKKVRREYGLEPKTTGKCLLCHQTKEAEKPNRKNLNAYGASIQKHDSFKPLLNKDDEYKWSDAELQTLVNVVKALNAEDTDKDGASNGEEIELGTFPADEKSTPSTKDLEKYRKEHKK